MVVVHSFVPKKKKKLFAVVGQDKNSKLTKKAALQLLLTEIGANGQSTLLAQED